jgi:CubicO group peptidase (beta-lactamase class C family)
VLSNGGEAGGVRLLSSKGCERALELQGEGADLVANFPMRWGMGYGLNSPLFNQIYGGRLGAKRIATWGGSGGSTVVNDFDSRMTVAYVMNKHVEHGGLDQRGIDIVCAAFDSIDGRARTAVPKWTGAAPGHSAGGPGHGARP